MTIDITGANDGVLPHRDNTARDGLKKSDTTQKAQRVFEKGARDPAQPSTDPEREHYISKFMKDDGLSRDVAAAKYDFFT
jgi:hypothetical protein